jgi:hypothetical protein
MDFYSPCRVDFVVAWPHRMLLLSGYTTTEGKSMTTHAHVNHGVLEDINNDIFSTFNPADELAIVGGTWAASGSATPGDGGGDVSHDSGNEATMPASSL